MEPSVVTSVRKLPAPTSDPTCALVCATSLEFTVLFAVVSPASAIMFTVVSGRYVRHGVSDGTEFDGDLLHVGNAGQIHSHGVGRESGTAGDAAGAADNRGAATNDVIGEAEDESMISARVTAFDARITSEWQGNIESSRTAMGLA